MSKGNLVRRQVIDRNGVTTTRWVKPEEASSPRDGFSSVSDFLPVPVLTVQKAASKEADALKEQIEEALRKSRGDGSRGLNSVIDSDGLFKAYKEDNVPLLEAMLACAAHPTPTMSNVLTAHRILKRHGVPEPERFLTPDAINLSHRIMVAVLGVRAERGGDSLEGDDIRYLALIADPADYHLIEQIVVERKIISSDEVESLLAEMKNDAIALSDGKL